MKYLAHIKHKGKHSTALGKVEMGVYDQSLIGISLKYREVPNEIMDVIDGKKAKKAAGRRAID